MMADKGRIVVQNDWEDIYREGGGKFWVSFKRTGSPSTHSCIACSKMASGETVLEPEDSCFTVEHHSPRHIRISFSDAHTTHSMTFVASSKQFSFHGKNKKVTCLDVAAGGLGLSSCESSTTISVWETSSGTIRRELSGHVGDLYTAKFFPSGIVVLSGGSDMQLKVWSVETGACAATMIGHRAGIQDCCFVERGRNVLSCSRDGTAKLWDVGQQNCIHTYQSDEGLGVVNSCDIHSVSSAVTDLGASTRANDKEVGTEGKVLLLASESRKVYAFGLNSKQKLFEVASPDSAVNSVRFITDVSYVFGTEDGTVSVYDLRNRGAPVRSYSGGRSSVQSILPHKQGFFYSTSDGSVVCVDETLSPSYELSGADCDAVYRVVHAGSEVYTSCRDGHVRVYSVS